MQGGKKMSRSENKSNSNLELVKATFMYVHNNGIFKQYDNVPLAIMKQETVMLILA
jgi:hypothetical protein